VQGRSKLVVNTKTPRHKKAAIQNGGLLVSWRLCVLASLRLGVDYLSPTQDRLPEIIGQAVEVGIILLANVLLQFPIGCPRNIPGYCPWLRVCAWVIDGRFIVQCTLIRTCVLFHNVHLIRMRMSVIIDPRSLVEPDDIHNERV